MLLLALLSMKPSWAMWWAYQRWSFLWPSTLCPAAALGSSPALLAYMHCQIRTARYNHYRVLPYCMAYCVWFMHKQCSWLDTCCIPTCLYSAVSHGLCIASLQFPNSDTSDSKPAIMVQVLALAMAYQAQTKSHLMRPPIDQVEPDILAKCLQYSRCGQAEHYNSSLVINQTSISDSG